MHRIDSDGATAQNLFTEGNPQTGTPATVVSADWLNDVQENLCKVVERLGVSLAKGNYDQITKAMCALGTPAGAIIEMGLERDADDYFPAVPLWDGDHVLEEENYPVLVPLLRAQKIKAWNGSAYVDSFSVTVSESTIIGSGTAWTNLINALAEEQLVHGSFSNWRSITIGGIEYPITGITVGSLLITVSGSPAAGAQTLYIYPHRVSAQAAQARVFKDSGRTMMSPDGITYLSGFRRRDRMQGHYHNILYQGSIATLAHDEGGSGSATTKDGAIGAIWSIGSPKTDGSNGTPRVGPTTDPKASIVYRYMWAQVYVA